MSFVGMDLGGGPDTTVITLHTKADLEIDSVIRMGGSYWIVGMRISKTSYWLTAAPWHRNLWWRICDAVQAWFE